MLIEIASIEVAASRRYLYIETSAFAFFWNYRERPVFNRKTANATA